METVRLLADDLTGALDTAAELVPLCGELPVVWSPDGMRGLLGSAGIDSGTREHDPAAAAAQVTRLLPLLRGSDIAFKKIDSLLRGPTLGEIAACFRGGAWTQAVLAPAFPFQGRVTRSGRQFALRNGYDEAVSDDLVAALQAQGVRAQGVRAQGVRAQGVRALAGETGAGLRPGINVFDAETDADLRRVVETVRHSGVLWVGTGGLAQALAADRPHPVMGALPGPILGLFGSDQATTAAQLGACHPHWLEITDMASHDVNERLERADVALVSFRLPIGTHRSVAAGQIALGIRRLIDAVRPPGTVVVAGGETLRSLCDAVGADHLRVRGRLVPGVPRSVIQGGRWHGVSVVSKSGAFGQASLLRDLILDRERADATGTES